MKTRLFFIAAFFSLSSSFFTQTSLSGIVKNQNGNPLPGTNVTVEGLNIGTYTDVNGNFQLNNLPTKSLVLLFEIPGSTITKKEIKPSEFNSPILVILYSNIKSLEEVQVVSTRSSEGSTSTSLINKEFLEKKNFGQDLPFLLETTPSVVTTSDAGTGIGYTGIRIRGIDASRINVTINGIPVNDPESHDVYWVNMPDLSSSIENLQIQRGVGSSTNGAAAFGASLNIKSQDISSAAFGILDNTYGSFNTLKTTIKAGTGLINNKFSLETRLSQITSDGFIDRATSDLKSYYLAVSYVGKKSVLKAIAFSGKEITYQSWYGTPESRVNGDPNEMNAYADRNGLSELDRSNLLNSGRSYNFYTYENQVDNYQQDNYQLHFTHSFKPNLIMNIAGHYTYGRGYYEEYRKDDELTDYGYNPVIIGNDTISSTDLIRRRWLDNDFIGGIYSLQYKLSNWNFIFGGAINTYLGEHFGEVIWARFAADGEVRDRYYENNAQKSEFSNYLKATYRFEKFSFFGDFQYRKINYSFLGIDDVNGELLDLEQNVPFNFFNPKVSVNYAFKNHQSIFGSFGIANREPVRKDFRESTPENRPKPENMSDLELGYLFNNNKLNMAANFYWMNYSNQLILTGQINDVGGYTRTNVKDSYRAGIELSTSYKISSSLQLNAALSLSQNKIQEINEYVDEYFDEEPYYSQKLISHQNSDLAFSPNIVGNAGFTVVPFKNFTVDWVSKYVGRQFLDNTSNVARSINPFTFSNLSLSYSLLHVFCKEITFAFQINNVFNALYENNGYTYSYLYDGETTTENFYYPQAGRNFMGRILIKL